MIFLILWEDAMTPCTLWGPETGRGSYGVYIGTHTTPPAARGGLAARIKLIRPIVVRAHHETQSYRDRSKVPPCPPTMGKHAHPWYAGNFGRGWWVDQAFLCTSWAFLSQSSAHFLIRDDVVNNSRFLRSPAPLPRLHLC